MKKSTKIWFAGAKLERKERSFSTQLISQEKVLSWRLTALRETDLNGLCTKAPCGFHREQDFMRERGNQSTGACLPF